ncbi:MAG: hypothetical protein ACYCOU_06355 [Sulfobacillus sp.]
MKKNKNTGTGGKVSTPFDRRCREAGGVLQWASDGLLPVCVRPRERYEDPTTVLFASPEPVNAPAGRRAKLVSYFEAVYPGISFAQVSEANLLKFYRNLEIWYELPGSPERALQPTRAAFMPFYRVPEAVNLQQFPDKPAFPADSWVEVFHAGNLNTDFYIPSDLFAGTYYYAARGSGVFLPLGKTLVARNKVHALKQLKVPDEIILEHAGNAFRRFLAIAERELKSAHPELPAAKVHEIALATQIRQMSGGKNAIRTVFPPEVCYYGLGDTGDSLLAWAAAQEGYDTVQLMREAQMGCDPRGVLVGFEIVHLLNPDDSAKELRTSVSQDYLRAGIPGYFVPKARTCGEN